MAEAEEKEGTALAASEEGKLTPAEIKAEKKALKAQAKELKKQRKALEEAADDEDEGGAVSVILVTILIIVIWLAILVLLIKLDVGGFGSNVLAPVLKDIPVINKILPEGSVETLPEGADGENVIEGGYDSLEDAVRRIKALELELEDAEQDIDAAEKTIDDLTAEFSRLKTFEDNQVEFEKIKDEFDEEVVFNSHAPSIEEYQKYYEQIDPTNAEILYKEVIRREQEDELLNEYAKAYSSMKPKAAAEIFESMTGSLDLAAKILDTMSADARGAILAQMDAEIAAQITKIMEPEEMEE